MINDNTNMNKSINIIKFIEDLRAQNNRHNRSEHTLKYINKYLPMNEMHHLIFLCWNPFLSKLEINCC